MKRLIHAGPEFLRSGLSHRSRSRPSLPSAVSPSRHPGRPAALRVFPSSSNAISYRPSSIAVPWAASPSLLAILSGFQLIFPGYSTALAPVPFLLSLFIFGMPHGASDLARLREHRGTDRWSTVAGPFSLYLAGMVAVIVLLSLQPAFGLSAFAVISAWHFGRSDLHGPTLPGDTGSSRSRDRAFALLRVASRGGLLITLPVAFHPSAVFTLVNEWMEILPGSAIPGPVWDSVNSTARVFALSSLAGQFFVLFILAAGRCPPSFRRELIEAASLILALTLLDPVFALGSYFLLWHGMRQIRFEGGTGARPAAVCLEMCGLDRRAPILPVPTVIAYLGLSFNLFETWNPLGQVALLLIFFAVVTPSHEILNTYLGKGREPDAPAP